MNSVIYIGIELYIWRAPKENIREKSEINDDKQYPAEIGSRQHMQPN
jgi:hypothetical protein